MDDLQINFEDLKEQYYDRGRAVWAVTTLRNVRVGANRPNLDRLLRHHDEEPPISDRETRQRDSVDFLLAFYSLLEIASMIRYIPNTFPETFREEAIWNLSNRATVRYYEEHYRILLPRLFRLRLKEDRRLHEKEEDEASKTLFQRFLGIHNRVEADDEIELFQWFLDDGSTGDDDITDTLRLLRSPARTMEALMKDRGKRTIVKQSVSGAQKFFIFCGEFDSLLQDAKRFPLLQSAMWTYYSYWFELISEKVNSRMRTIVTSFQEWTPDQSAAELGARVRPDKKQIKQYVTVINGVLDRLFSGTYGRALRRAV